MNFKYSLFLLIAASLLLVQCKKEPGCTDSNAFNYDSDAKVNCCCEYLMTFDPEGTAGKYDITWKNVSGSTSTIGNVSNTWTVEYVVTLGATVSMTVTNKSSDSTSTAVANILKGDQIFLTNTATGIGATASVSGIVN